MTMTPALVLAAVSIGSLHSLAPDHWVPFAALARAERWTARRTALVTAICGLGHVTVSVLLGLLTLVLGVELLEVFGRRLESAAGLLLTGFGLAYALWGVRRRIAGHLHAHAHGHVHGHAHAGARPLTPWALFFLFSADPCVALFPLLFASAPLGWISTAAVVAAYEAATIGTMLAMVVPARAAAARVSASWLDRWSDVVAGGVVATVGVTVMMMGI